jgi:RNA polymerase sigma factor (sigma-70 family)
MCVAGDELAWEALIFRYYRLVHSIPVGYHLDKSDCEEVVQNVCKALVKSVDSIRDGGAVFAWLMTTAQRESMAVKAKRKRDVVPAELEIEEPLDPAGTLEEIILSAEKQHGLRQVLDNWDSPCRLLIESLYFEELSYKETAARLGRSHKGMGSRQARCLDKLRSMLTERGITNL